MTGDGTNGAPADARALAEARFAASIDVPERFFAAEADAIARACLQMARRFHRGGRLIVFGGGAAASDAQHVAVEFVHPVIVGKRALAAIALTADAGAITAAVQGGGAAAAFVRPLEALARPEDIALGLADGAEDAAVSEALAAAGRRGLLTIGLFGPGDAPPEPALDARFAVPSADPTVVQEVHETLYHVLWELVHVYFEHEGLLG